MLRHNQPKKKEDKTIIGDEWNEEDHPLLICSWCQCSLVRLSSGNNSPSWFCRRCSISYEPDQTEIRKKSKLGTQREEVEPAVTSIQTNMEGEVEIRHSVPVRGGFAELAKKGTIRFISYQEF